MKTNAYRVEGLEVIETASVDQLRALQLSRLKWSVRHTYDNVEHYRSKCVARGVHPNDLQQLDQLALFPLTAKRDLRDTYPFGMFAVPQGQVRRVHASSGTTGRPIVVGYTANDIDTWANLMARSIRASGGRPGDKVHIAYGYGLFTGGLGAHYGAERLGCMVIPMSGGQTEKQVQLIQDFRPRIIMVTPSYVLNIVEAMEKQGINAKGCSLEIGIFGAEPWSGRMRGEIEHRLGIDAVDIYGLTEVMGPGVANECLETKDGLTIWEDHFYPEIIDPETEEVLPEGAFGELVFTSLTKEAFPVIRYRTRDLTRLLPGTARTMRRMDRITGRSDDMLIIRGVNVFPSQIEELIMRLPGLAPIYELLVSKEGPLDELAVNVELRDFATANEAGKLGKELQQSIKVQVGVTTKVYVLGPDSIERTAVGKARRVIDQRPRL